MAVSKRLRYEVLRRDNHQCRYCCATAPDATLTIDHVRPRTLGGNDDPSNLVTACKDCNAGKSASSPDAPIVADVELRSEVWTEAVQRASAQRELEHQGRVACRQWFNGLWDVWGVGPAEDAERTRVPRGDGWFNTVWRFREQGLSAEYIASAIEIAMMTEKVAADDKWRYFCGVCWRELDRRQELATTSFQQKARELLGSGPPFAPVPEDEDGEGDEFPIMDMVDHFLDHLLEALGVIDQRRKIALRALWDAMGQADQVWQRVHPHFGDVVPAVDSGGRPLTRREATEEFLFSLIAFDMHQIRRVTDGSE